MKDSKVYLKRRKKHCELTVVVHYSAEVNHPPQYDGFQPAYYEKLFLQREMATSHPAVNMAHT